MRFVSLKIQAFGPYDEPVIFPFDRLTGLFTITGDTGAGKSTIFDALTFGLYGRMSSESREVKEARCTFSPATRRTEVVLKFIHLDKEYTLTRYLQGKDLSPKATLVADGVSESGEKAVTKYVSDMIGLKVEQWRMIAVLPQGEFSKLLKADQADRAGIIKTIFNTDKYGKYVEKLKAMNAQAHSEKTQCRNEIATAASPVKTDNGELAGMISALPTDTAMVYQLPDILHMLEEQNTGDSKFIEGFSKELTKLKEEAGKRAADLSKAEGIVKEYATLRKYEEEWDNLDTKKGEMDELERNTTRSEKAVNHVKRTEKDLEDSLKKVREHESNIKSMTLTRDELEASKKILGEKADAARKERSDNSGLIDRKASLEGSLGDYELVDAKRREKSDAEKEIERIVGELKTNSESITELGKEKVANEAFINQNSDIKTKILSAEQEKKELDDKVGELRKLADNCKGYILDKGRLEAAYSDWQKEEEKYKRFSETENHLREVLAMNKFGIIARDDLKEGEPCPVCGSVHHPAPAVMSEDKASQKDLDKAVKATAAQLTVMSGAKSAFDTLSGTLGNVHDNIMSELARAGIEGEPDNTAIARIEEKKGNLETQIETKKSLLENMTQISEKKDRLQVRNIEIASKLESLVSDEKSLNGTLNEYKGAVIAAEAVLSSKKLEYSTLAEAKQEIERVKTILTELNKAVEDADMEYKQVCEKLSKKVGELDIETNNLTESKTKAETANDVFIKTYSDEGFESPEDYHASLGDEKVIAGNRETLNTYKEEILKAKTLLDEQREKLKDIPMPESLETLKTLKEQAQQSYDEANRKLTLSQERLKNNEDILGKLRSLEERFDKADHHASVTERVYKIAIGDLDKNKSMSYDAFVQEQYFQSIVNDAASRFFKLSRGTFKLYSKSAEGESLSKKNLKLWVHDLETDTDRVIDCLSGGETFMASLSLALGMSDMIQRCAGGRSIESLFIDEGFGTLDKETLNQAIRLLGDVAGNKGSVGLITHLDELIESIPRRVEITKNGKKGSKVEVF